MGKRELIGILKDQIRMLTWGHVVEGEIRFIRRAGRFRVECNYSFGKNGGGGTTWKRSDGAKDLAKLQRKVEESRLRLEEVRRIEDGITAATMGIERGG